LVSNLYEAHRYKINEIKLNMKEEKLCFNGGLELNGNKTKRSY
jgi:hypothetical protein